MLRLVFLTTILLSSCTALNIGPQQQQQSRSQFLKNAFAASLATTIATSRPGVAAATAALEPKLTNLSNNDLKNIILKDITERSFLATGKLTRAVYDEKATFTDEIDVYELDKWIVGTQRLFVGDKSRVALVGDIDVTSERVEFRFDEDLMFNIPLLKPVVSLTGKVVLNRDATTGLITSYQEFWDQDVSTVIKSAKF